MKFAKFDKTLTLAANFKCRGQKGSQIGVKPDGSILVRLKGKDMSELHERVFDRDGWVCVEGKDIWQIGCSGPLELSHDVPRGRGGSDTEENTHVRCKKHHMLRDNVYVKLRSSE